MINSKTSGSHPGGRIKKVCLNKIRGYPRVEETERESQDEDVVKGMVDEIGYGRAHSISWATQKGTKPLGEGTNVRSKEGVEGVSEGVVGAKPAVSDAGQTQA